MSGLEWHQLADEVAEELTERRWYCRGPDDELADPGGDVLLDYLPGRFPARRDEGRGIAAGPALADGGGQFGRNTAACDGKTDAEVVGLDLAARRRGGGLDRLPRCPRLAGGEQATQPPVGKPADAPKRVRNAATEPDVERLGRQRPHVRAVDGEEFAAE